MAHHVEPAQGVFGPGSVLFFYAGQKATSLDHSSETTYALERILETDKGRPMRVRAPFRRGRAIATSPLHEASFETNRFYQAGLLEAPDIWLWDFVVGGMSKTLPFHLEGLDPVLVPGGPGPGGAAGGVRGGDSRRAPPERVA